VTSFTMLLYQDAFVEMNKAISRFPQPNYVVCKVAEEAGEVVKAAVHCAEGRETANSVRQEIVQAMAMLLRLYVEGDQVIGVPSIMDAEIASIAAAEEFR
jgi:phosphoribosyl-ATP pyrophosphohydrolase